MARPGLGKLWLGQAWAERGKARPGQTVVRPGLGRLPRQTVARPGLGKPWLGKARPACATSGGPDLADDRGPCRVRPAWAD
eukprot:186286-Chlamydomonas_euryale.AAC.2